MSRGPDAGTMLAREIEASARGAGCTLSVTASNWTRWASATFTGAQHSMTLAGEDSAALNAWLAALPEMDLHVARNLVADVTVAHVLRSNGAVEVDIQALTVAEF